jgi:hypothetical protein
MAIDSSARRSRRALLASGLGSLAALVASALGRPLTTRAADGDTVVVGGEFQATSVTKITQTTGGEVAIEGVAGTDFANGGHGVWGHTIGHGRHDPDSGPAGVYGTAYSPYGTLAGVKGEGSGLGVLGIGQVGVRGKSSRVDLAAEGTGRLLQKPTGLVGPPTVGHHDVGEQIRDAAGDLWLCVAQGYPAGSPGLWRKVHLEAVRSPVSPGTVTRVAGPDRFATAAAISATTFEPGVPVAYIAYAYNFPDALAGAAAAGTLPGPILFAAANLPLNASTTKELERLKPKRIVILGGTGVISNAVQNALAPYAVGG